MRHRPYTSPPCNVSGDDNLDGNLGNLGAKEATRWNCSGHRPPYFGFLISSLQCKQMKIERLPITDIIRKRKESLTFGLLMMLPR